ncbi:MAG: GspH/FimT family pseudopilin [Pseudomonadales bacterium]
MQRGISLIELLVVATVAALLLGVALPAFEALPLRQRSTAAVNAIVAAVHAARTAAVLANQTVTLCPAAAGRCLGRDQWHQGAMLFHDGNRNGQRDGGELVVSELAPLTDSGRIYWRAFRSRSYLQFRPQGFTRWQNGSFVYCPDQDDPSLRRVVIINAQGRVRLGRDRNGDGVVEDAGGAVPRCPTQ